MTGTSTTAALAGGLTGLAVLCLWQARQVARVERARRRMGGESRADARPTERRVLVREEALRLLRESGAILPQRDLTWVVNEVADEVVGFRPIEFLLKDPSVTEDIPDEV